MLLAALSYLLDLQKTLKLLAVQMNGRAEVFDIMVFAFSYFPKSDH